VIYQACNSLQLNPAFHHIPSNHITCHSITSHAIQSHPIPFHCMHIHPACCILPTKSLPIVLHRPPSSPIDIAPFCSGPTEAHNTIHVHLIYNSGSQNSSSPLGAYNSTHRTVNAAPHRTARGRSRTQRPSVSADQVQMSRKD
jgi:hypothetical protein